MSNERNIRTTIIAIMLGQAVTISAQHINLWRGNGSQADWSDPYKWELQHVPTGDEAVHFRQPNSIIMINSTVELDNGMMLYGRDLFLEGNGNLNLWSPLPHKRTVNIPASASGQANLTLGDTLTLNGRIALAAKAFGTSASKGSVTLKDRSTISGSLLIGNSGTGTGQVFIEDQATFRISSLELNTLAEKGGAAEIHILGGIARLEIDTDPFEIFMADPSRKIIVGESGLLRIDSDLPIERKNELISALIANKRIVAAGDSQLTTPEILKNMILLKAEYVDPVKPVGESVAATVTPSLSVIAKNRPPVKEVKPAAVREPASEKPKVSLESLLQEMQTNSEPEIVAQAPVKPEATAARPRRSAKNNTALPLAGYIVFGSTILFFMRPQKSGK